MRTRFIKTFDPFVYAIPATNILSRAKRLSIASVFILLSGCMGSTYTPAQLASDFTDLELCQAAIFHGVGSVKNTEDVIAEINRRGLISDEEWQLVNTSTPQSRKLMVGMSECSMLLVMNNNSYQITENVSQFGASRIYEYGHYGHGPYIFTNEGKVTSWTN